MAYRQIAFADTYVPLDHGQVMMSPCIEAKIIQTLQLSPEDKVLEIGTGSGYLTALLAQSVQHVYSVDIFNEFLTAADAKFKRLNLENITLLEGNAANGWSNQQPYDIICITGSLPVLPESFQQQMKIGGKLFAIIGSQQIMQAMLITRMSENQWRHRSLFETYIPALLHGSKPKKFYF